MVLVMGCSRDAEAQKFVDDLGSLDDAVDAVVRDAPNADGLAKAEGLVDAKQASLHKSMMSLGDANLGDSARQAIMNACVKNCGTARIARDEVYNAVLGTNPELRLRARKLGRALCGIGVTGDGDKAMLAEFADNSP
jgi:hypothetical protein